MSTSSLSPLLGVVLLAVIVVLRVQAAASRRKKAFLPPGPTPLPFIGNLLDMPRTHLGREFLDLTKQYGDLVHLRFLGQTIILVGSYKVASDLLDKRSINYSDRPDSIMVPLVGLDWLFSFMNYGKEWRDHRRAFQSQMNPDALRSYESIRLGVARGLLQRILEAPEDLAEHLDFAFAATSMRMVYGLEVRERNDEHFKLIRMVANVGEQVGIPGRFLVESLPIIRHIPAWFPGGGFKQWARDANRDVNFAVDYIFNAAKRAMNQDAVKESFVRQLLDPVSLDESRRMQMEGIVRGMTATAYIAGADTTTSAIRAFFIAMSLYPTVQKKAQAELDAVVGSGRLPEFGDESSLPYIGALIKELLRWHVVVPIGVPHRVVADDEYAGCFIPGGATILVNAWGISRDRDLYPNPEQFIPERFLRDGILNAEGKDPSDFVFGFGRRICPGQHFAETALFILCSSLLWAFDIYVPIDSAGNPTEVEYKATNYALASRPEVYNYTIKPRSLQVEKLVRDAE